MENSYYFNFLKHRECKSLPSEPLPEPRVLAPEPLHQQLVPRDPENRSVLTLYFLPHRQHAAALLQNNDAVVRQGLLQAVEPVDVPNRIQRERERRVPVR